LSPLLHDLTELQDNDAMCMVDDQGIIDAGFFELKHLRRHVSRIATGARCCTGEFKQWPSPHASGNKKARPEPRLENVCREIT
jgi:hypothetical protein